MRKNGNLKNKDSTQEMSFFQLLLEKLFHRGGEDAEKRRQLRLIAKEISKSKYKFYKPSTGEVLPSLGKVFFLLYKTVGPVQLLFQNTSVSKVLKNLVIELSLSPEQVSALSSLQEEKLLERSQTVPVKNMIQEAKNAIRIVSAEFTSEKSATIDKIYSELLAFVNFANFDFFFLLKKLNPSLVERNFTVVPHFEAGRADHVVDDLRDFVAVAYGLPTDCDWAPVFQVLKTYKGVEPVMPAAWTKVLSIVKELKRSGILELMVRHISQNPQEVLKYDVISEKIVDNWLQKTKSQVDLFLQKLQTEKRNSKIVELTSQIFGNNVVVRLKNYTEKANSVFEQKMIPGYEYVEPLNYLKAFLLDFVKKEVRSLADLFLIRGQWVTQESSSELSECFHSLLDLSDKLVQFDDELADDNTVGSKLYNAIVRIDRERDQSRIIRQLLKDVNEKAENMIVSATKDLIVFGKNIKNLLEDFLKPRHEILINWKEIDSNSEPNVKTQVTLVYKKIYSFVMLMQYYIKKD